MTSTVPREWLKYKYLSPRKILLGLREAELSLPLHELHPKAATLRTRGLRQFLEGRQAALFSYGMGTILGTDVLFAQVENQDYDIICKFSTNGGTNYVPVQLKELVPDTFPNAQTLQNEINKLSKYVDSADLTVAFHLNRRAHLNFSELVVPKNTVAAIWLYGALDAKQARWHLTGNLVGTQGCTYEFEYPTEA